MTADAPIVYAAHHAMLRLRLRLWLVLMAAPVSCADGTISGRVAGMEIHVQSVGMLARSYPFSLSGNPNHILGVVTTVVQMSDQPDACMELRNNRNVPGSRHIDFIFGQVNAQGQSLAPSIDQSYTALPQLQMSPDQRSDVVRDFAVLTEGFAVAILHAGSASGTDTLSAEQRVSVAGSMTITNTSQAGLQANYHFTMGTQQDIIEGAFLATPCSP